MKRKNFLKGALLGALVMFIIMIVGGGWFILHRQTKGILSQTDEERAYRQKLQTIKQLIDQQYLYSDDIDEQEVNDGMLAGYVGALGDQYSAYFDKEATEELLNGVSGDFGGIGVTMRRHTDTNLIEFVKISKGSPAKKAGFKVGDILYKIDGKEIADKDWNDIVTMVRGEVGTKVTITVVRE